MKSVKFILIVIVIIVLLSGCSVQANSQKADIQGGTLDLSAWDFNGATRLDGQWEFYWNQFVTGKDLQTTKPDMYVQVPNTWTRYSIGGKDLPGQGYATYRLHVKTDLQEHTMLGLNINPLSSAYKIYINELLIASNGNASENASEELGEYKPQAVYFIVPAREFDIIVQVSNFTHARGGMWYSLSMGDAESIHTLHEQAREKEIFLLGGLLIVGLFYLVLFFLIRELRYSLYFACLCFIMMIAIDMVGQYILPALLPGISLSTVICIWYSSTTWAMFFLVMFIHELYKTKISGLILKINLVECIALQIIYLFTPPAAYTNAAYLMDLFEIISVFFSIFIVAVGMKKGYKYGWLNIIAIGILLFTYIHDVMYMINAITVSYGEILYIGLLFFMFMQMVIQAQRIKLYYSDKLAAEQRMLHAQIKPHFLFNSLNTFISISRYDPEKARELLLNFSNYLRRSFDFESSNQFVPLDNEIELARAYAAIEKARFEERLEVEFKLPENLSVKVPILTLQPILENALIHGLLPKPEGGKIEVIIEKVKNSIYFTVKDNGVGIKEKMEDLLQKEREGVGLSNIDRRLRQLYRRGLEIKSSPDEGTQVCWEIPIKKRRGHANDKRGNHR